MGKGKRRPDRERRPTAGMEDRGRQPRSSLSRDETRTPRAIAPNPRRRNPLWGFRIVDLGGPWCWTELDGAGLGEVLARLRALESMTWDEIDGPTGSHHVATAKLSRDARNRLVEIRQDDAESLFSIRVTGERRVWGILDEHVLRMLWWDPRHEVCPSIKKHT